MKIAILLSLLIVFGCAQTKVERVHEHEVTDLSGRWNDTDSRLVTEEMFGDCISAPWLIQAKSNLDRPPTIVFGSVRNYSSEHINMDTFLEDLQQALINSGKVKFVADAGERTAIRDEQADQRVNSSSGSQVVQAMGADFLLSGELSSIEDSAGNEAAVLYQVNLKLLDIKSNVIVWNGEKKIKKLITRSSLK